MDELGCFTLGVVFNENKSQCSRAEYPKGTKCTKNIPLCDVLPMLAGNNMNSMVFVGFLGILLVNARNPH
jgi:hypothetical protein